VRRAGLLVALLAAIGCGDSPRPSCPPCPAGMQCDPKVGACVGWRTPLLDALPPDAPVDAGGG